MYRVYLNNTLLDENDVIGIAEGAEFSIVREFGIGNNEQILRDKTDVQLKFSGAAYTLLCDARKNDYCAKITIRIDMYCDPAWETIFEGIIQQKYIELSINKYIANVTAIRDNSFSGLVRDNLNTDIPLYYTKTINCDPLQLISQTYTMQTDPTNPNTTKTIIAYDVLDVLQYYLNYITNNAIEIRSDYLTATTLGDVRFAITTGFNMHNTTGTLDETVPLLSFQKVFEELRKKLKVYMGVEYDGDTPYLRIERESYFFDDTTEILNITDIPAEVIEKIDTSLLYNQIKVGSTTWELQDAEATPDYPQEKLIAWNEETYTNCGGCMGEKDSELDLVSGFIIDSNVIYEALNEANGSDYTNDDSIFMFHYYIDGTDRIGLVTNDDVYGKDIYNEEITNELVLEKWSATSCAATYRNPANAMSVSDSGPTVVSEVFTIFTEIGITEKAMLGDVIYDSENNISIIDVSSANPTGSTLPNSPITETASVFYVPQTGNYNFYAKTTLEFCDTPGFLTTLDATYSIVICVYSNDTLGTLLNEYEYSKSQVVTILDPTLDPIFLQIETGNIGLSSGNVVYVKYRIVYDEASNVSATICAKDSFFMIIDDSNNCTNIDQSTSALPFTIELQYPICYSEFKNIKQNKRGYVTLMGNKYYIRELTYRPKKLSNLVLLGANSICSTN